MADSEGQRGIQKLLAAEQEAQEIVGKARKGANFGRPRQTPRPKMPLTTRLTRPPSLSRSQDCAPEAGPG